MTKSEAEEIHSHGPVLDRLRICLQNMYMQCYAEVVVSIEL